MHPRLFTTPYFTFHTFGVFLAAAYGMALWWLVRGARRTGINPERAMGLGVWVVIGAVVGAKALMILRSLPEYAAHPSDLWSLSTIQSAGDFYGGFIGALFAAMAFFARYPDVPRWRMADLCGPAIALGQAIGRIGCFMAGDDYGRPTHLPWAVTFKDPDAADIGGAPLGIPLHPVQLYESLVCLALFFFRAVGAAQAFRGSDHSVLFDPICDCALPAGIRAGGCGSGICVRRFAVDLAIYCDPAIADLRTVNFSKNQSLEACEILSFQGRHLDRLFGRVNS